MLIQTTDLTFAYPGHAPVLRGVSLSLAEGERVGVAGPSGCGKTTLLLCLAGLVERKLLGGTVILGGKPIEQYSRAELAEQVGLLFQNPEEQFVGLTVAEDIWYGWRRLGGQAEAAARIEQALQLFRLNGRREDLLENLSWGERKRLALAELWLHRAPVLLLDAPLAGMGEEDTALLTAVLEGGQGAILTAAREEELQGFCSRVVRLV